LIFKTDDKNVLLYDMCPTYTVFVRQV